jgi:predicted ATPase
MELLRGLVRSREPPVLRAELAAGAPVVAQLVPEVRELLPDLPPVPELEPREARFRLFDAITVVLQNVARSQPLLLVLDDIHWADKPSLLLLEFVLPYMRSSPVLVLGTYRDTDLEDHAPLADVLGSLWREPSFEVVPLEGLTIEAIGELLDCSLDRRISVGGSGPDLARELWQVTEGNPLFVREELQYLAEEDRWPSGRDKRDRARPGSWTSAFPRACGMSSAFASQGSRRQPTIC